MSSNPPSSRQRVGDDWSLFATVIGAGRDVVFLHGLPHDARDLLGLAEGLSSEARSHVIELPGYLESTPLSPPPSVAACRARIARYIRERCESAPWVVGFSGGSYRAIDLALDGGVPLAGLVVMAPLAGVSEAMAGALNGGADAIEAGVDIAEGLVPGWFSAAYLESHGADALEVARAALTSGTPADLAADARGFAQAPDLNPRLRSLSLPVHLVVGEVDVTTPAENARAMAAEIPSAHLAVLPQSGHFVHHEAREQVIELLRSALSG